jgi:hypothetical protein
MIWAAPLLIVVGTGAAGGKVASTYDEAACSDTEIARVEPRADETDCSEAPPPVPTVIDCNDARASLWMAEMIGSCDMPRASGPTLPPTLNAVGRGAARVCTGERCGYEQLPLRAPLRNLDDGSPTVPSAIAFPFHAAIARLDDPLVRRTSQIEESGLERPPRASVSR